MTARLRPMSLGEILDRTFQIYRSKFWELLGIAALGTAASLSVNFADSVWFDVRALLPAARQPRGVGLEMRWFGWAVITSIP